MAQTTTEAKQAGRRKTSLTDAQGQQWYLQAGTLSPCELRKDSGEQQKHLEMPTLAVAVGAAGDDYSPV